MNTETKYADKVSPEHQMAIEAIGFMRQLLAQFREHYEKLDKAERDMHNVGFILDPTLYRDMISSRGFAQQMRLVRAALTFLKELDAVAIEIGQ